MFEKLQAVSRVLILPAVALYLAGFICITGYYARFGFITFDIVNARFLIAGFHSLLAVAICLALVWLIRRRFEGERFFSWSMTVQRYFSYLELVMYPYVAAQPLLGFYFVGSLSKMSDPDALHFGPILGRWDIAGLLLRRWHLPNGSDAGFVAGGTFYLAFYALMIVVPVGLIVIALKRHHPLRRLATADKKPIATTPDAAPQAFIGNDLKSQLAYAMGYWLKDSLLRRLVVISVDVAFMSALIVLATFSFWKSRSQLVDIQALAHPSLDTSTLYFWLLATTLSCMFFLNVRMPRPINLDLFKSFDPYIFSDALRQLTVPILGSLFLFGAMIFPRIPFEMGGGAPRTEIVNLKGVTQPPLAVFLIGESDQFLFAVHAKGRGVEALQVNKAEVLSIVGHPGT